MQEARTQDDGRRILLVDDEPAHVEAVRRAFDAAGLKGSLRAAGTLREYREMAAADPPEIAIIDLNLPDGRALEVLSWPPEAGAFPVVVMTSYGNQEVAVEAMKAGALDYVVKSPEAFAGMPRTVERALREWDLLQERRRAEEALRASEEKFRGMAEQVTDVLFVTDTQGRIGYLSPSTSRVFGWSPEEMVGRHFAEFLPEEEIPRAMSHFQAAMGSGQISRRLALTMKRKDGSVFSGELSGSRVRQDGAVAGATGLIRDITDRQRAEEALRKSEETYRALVEGLPDIVMRFDRQGRHLFVSENVGDLVELQAARFIGKTHCELGFPEAQCRFWEAAIEGVFDSGAPFETEFMIDGKRGPVIHNWRLAPERDERGAVQSVLSISRDITAQRRAEENYRTLFREMLDGFALHEIVCDARGRPVDYRFLAVNPAFERMTGLKAQDIAGKTVLEVTPGIEPHWIETYGKVALTGEPAFFESSAEELGRQFEVTAFRPAPNQFVCIFADITERKRAEEALRESEERFRELAELLPETIFEMDPRGALTFVNQRAFDCFGYGPQDLVRGLNALEMIAAQDRDEARENIQKVLRGEAVGMTEYTAQRKDGCVFPALLHSTMFLRRGEPAGLRGFIIDITERKQAEARLAQAQKMESIGRLAGGVAHDFNNLLTVINGYSQLLLGKLNAADPLRAGLNEIHKAGERAAGLTQQLLAFSRKQVLQPRVLDLNRVVGEMRSMIERLVGEDVQVRVELSKVAGTIRADPHQVEQVIMNLVVNARDAMPRGGRLLIETGVVELDSSYARSHPEARAGRYVRLAVSDTGVGMDPETRRRIFEPFFTTKGVGKGTGLGLSMVEGIVAQSGGHIQVYSEPGQGTTFKVYLPSAEEGVAIVEAGMPEAAALGGKEAVLVVEDQAEVREYAVTVLKAYGYRVAQADGAAQALSVFERERGGIDLVLTDVVMPNVGGAELAGRLEKLQPGIKVLFMSGYTDNVIVHHGVLDEGAHFIQKPFSPEQLAARVREVLGPTKRPGRILVADDEAAVRGSLREMLEQGGYEVIEAEDGKQALKRAREGGVDLVVTDLIMPEQEGIETIQALRKELPGIGIIAISGKFEGPYLKMASVLGADAALAKPVSRELLLARVAEVLKSRR